MGLLIIAHGERRESEVNNAAMRLVSDLRGRRIAAHVEIRFLSGTPTIAQALDSYAGLDVLVYPLFMTDGYFARHARDQLRHGVTANGREPSSLKVFPPLGLDPALVDVIARRTASAACDPKSKVVLVAHGSSRDQASYESTEALARRLRALMRRDGVVTAYLEQSPTLGEILSGCDGPAVVVGLFAGDGLHGQVDLPRSVGDLQRSDVVFVGNVGTWPEIGDIISARVAGDADMAKRV